MADQPALVLSGLSKTFGAFHAVEGLDLEARTGELLALLGPNGAGKTTTIRMVMGLLTPTAGRASICGHDCFAEHAVAMRHVGYLPDEPSFPDYLSGRELAAFTGSMHGMERAAAEAAAATLARRLAIDAALDEYAVNFSTGMKKKLALLLALMHRPPLVILDEPMNGLDPYAIREVQQLLRELVAEGRTVVFSTHLLDQAERLSDRVAIMRRGRLAALGSPQELKAAHAGDASLEDVFFAVTAQDGERGG